MILQPAALSKATCFNQLELVPNSGERYFHIFGSGENKVNLAGIEIRVGLSKKWVEFEWSWGGVRLLGWNSGRINGNKVECWVTMGSG